MAAKLPGGRTPEQLVDVLNQLSCVERATARNVTVEATIEGPTVPPTVLGEIARSNFALDDVDREGDCRVAEFVPEDEMEN